MAGQEKEVLEDEMTGQASGKAADNPEKAENKAAGEKKGTAGAGSRGCGPEAKAGGQAERGAGAGAKAGGQADSEAEPQEDGKNQGEEAEEGDEGQSEERAESQAEGESKDPSGAAGAEGTGEKKSFFRKKKDKRDEQIEELNDRVKRQMAEFDNFRKRTEKEKSAMYEVGARSVLEKLLPIVDNFERGLASLEEGQKQEPFAVGMEKTYQLLEKMLEEMEVKPIEAVGKEFDPNLHNAVMHVEDEEAGDNIIVEEFQKGYTYRDVVLRTSMVKVAN